MISERTHPIIQLTHDQLVELMRPVVQGRVLRSQLLIGGAVNTNYRVWTDSRDYVLRLYARGKEHCVLEEAVWRKVGGVVSLPEMFFADAQAEYPYGIFSYARGEPMHRLEPETVQGQSEKIGHVMATIHQFAFEEAGLFGPDLSITCSFPNDSSPYFIESERLFVHSKRLRQRIGDGLANRCVAFLRNNASAFAGVEKPCLVHSDFHLHNLLWDRELGVTVVDWEFCHAGSPLIDFGILHRFSRFLNWELLERGYRDGGGWLPDHWQRMAQVTDLVNIAQLLDSQAERPRFYQGLVKRLLQVLSI